MEFSFIADIATVLSELDRLLVELQTKLADVTPETQTRSKWQEKLDRREEVWMEMRPTIMEAKLCQAYLPDVVCFVIFPCRLMWYITLIEILLTACSMNFCHLVLCIYI